MHTPDRQHDAVAPDQPVEEGIAAAPATGLPLGGVQGVLSRGSLGSGQQRALAAGAARGLGNATLSRMLAGPMAIARMPVADAKKAILAAGSGLGTDEEAIYHAIRECDDRAALKADPAVIAELDDELSGWERWKATLLLDLGPEVGWPPAVKELLTAMEGAGTDEARIFRALSGLSEADVTRIGRVGGIMAALEDELSGADLEAARQLLSGSYARAIAYHRANVAMMVAELNTWRTGTDVYLRNTAEWLAPTAGGSPKNNLYTCSPTHDAAARATAHGETGKTAYFGADKLHPDDSSTYAAHIDDRTGLRYAPASIGGEHLDRDIWVYDPQRWGAAIVRDQIVAHEVQHDADRHDSEEGHDHAYKSPEESWNRYKTEFRAYWTGQQFPTSSFSPLSGSATAPWDNAKQKAIFDHMMAGVYAEFVAPNYNGNTVVDGARFQDLVHGYKEPEGVNLINSPRIDDFFLSLQACTPAATDMATAPLSTLATRARGLDADDLAAVNAASASRLHRMLEDNLAASAFAAIAMILGGGTIPGWASVNLGPARRAILAAGAGLGTDEQAIYDAIASSSDAERAAMRSDRVIQGVLDDELSGHDLWLARQYLQYGPRSRWPQSVLDQDK
jgi:hypothetical protein